MSNFKDAGATGDKPDELGSSPAAQQNAETKNSQNGNTGNGNGDKKTKPDQTKKIGLVAFIQLTEPNKYVEAMLKSKRAMETHTETEWQQIVKDMLETKVG
jgi:hypothetical protein